MYNLKILYVNHNNFIQQNKYLKVYKYLFQVTFLHIIVIIQNYIFRGIVIYLFKNYTTFQKTNINVYCKILKLNNSNKFTISDSYLNYLFDLLHDTYVNKDVQTHNFIFYQFSASLYYYVFTLRHT